MGDSSAIRIDPFLKSPPFLLPFELSLVELLLSRPAMFDEDTTFLILVLLSYDDCKIGMLPIAELVDLYYSTFKLRAVLYSVSSKSEAFLSKLVLGL